MATLAEQIKAIIADHRLTSVSFSASLDDRFPCWHAYAHAGEGLCESGAGATPEEALNLAIGLINARRSPSVPVLEAA